MTGFSRRLAVLCCLSILGVALMIGMVVGSLTGLPGVLAYAVVAGLMLGLAIARGRRLLRDGRGPAPPPPAPPPPGRSCSCCTATHTDRAKVV